MPRWRRRRFQRLRKSARFARFVLVSWTEYAQTSESVRAFDAQMFASVLMDEVREWLGPEHARLAPTVVIAAPDDEETEDRR